MKRLLFYMILLLPFLPSCMRDDRNLNTYNCNSGVLVACSGNFMFGNASLCYYNPQTGEVENHVFLEANGIPLGDVAQSLSMFDSTVYVVVNNSGKIYAFDSHSFIAKGRINGLTSPRYMYFLSKTKAYVTDLYAKKIWIVNPETFSITGSIDVNNNSSDAYQHSTEQLLRYQDYVFVSCWSYDNKILVINTNNDLVVDSIEVGTQPAKMIIDRYNKIWVYCDGGYEGSSFGSENPQIYRIDAETRSVENVFEVEGSNFSTVMCLNGTGDTLYFAAGDVFRMSVGDNNLPQQVYIDASGKNISALECDPFTGDLYIADAVDFLQDGMVYRYAPDATLIDSFPAGIIPVDFLFYE